MEETQTLAQFYQLKRELSQAAEEISRLTSDNFGKRTLTKKDYLSLLDLMRETVATTRVTVGFLKIIFKVSPEMSDAEEHSVHSVDTSKTELGG